MGTVYTVLVLHGYSVHSPSITWAQCTHSQYYMGTVYTVLVLHGHSVHSPSITWAQCTQT